MTTILDPLYGRVDLPDFVRDIVHTPELQRLSEIRLMNVPGWTMLGATTITRLEHALGVAHLADVYSTASRLPDLERNNLILGCLIHDVASFPYGHLVEHIFKRFFPGSPDHSQRLLADIFNNKEDLPIYRGAGCELYRKLLRSVATFGRSPRLAACLVLGPEAVQDSDDVTYYDTLSKDVVAGLHRLISGSMDLDNIDNVFRVASRFGLRFDPQSPERLTASVVLSGPLIRVHEEHVSLIEEWQRVRAEVYEIFFTHPDILAMKTLLTYCVEHCLCSGLLHELDWVQTDVQLLELLLGIDAIRQEARQLLLGHELTCHYLLACPVSGIDYLIPQLPDLRSEIASSIIIEDVKRRKTDTAATIERDCSNRCVHIAAEYDIGATTRRCDVEIISGNGSSTRKHLGKNSNRIVLSLLLPSSCKLKSPGAAGIVIDAIARRVGCARTDITHIPRPGMKMKHLSTTVAASGDLF